MVRPEGVEPPTSWFAPSLLVLSAGFEPAASWFEATRSIQMSYESKIRSDGVKSQALYIYPDITSGPKSNWRMRHNYI